jgi:quercetin 2,3-dioxygenase
MVCTGSRRVVLKTYVLALGRDAVRLAWWVMNPVLDLVPLGMPWQTLDPFLACMHHDDRYPAGNDHMGPAASLAGREIGHDFGGVDGWRMYHGDTVPGFPQHPHRGFETVTIVRRGFVDHHDSLGAAGRYGQGDAQWLTAGRGVVHAEMFPLLHQDGPNPLELFQIWLNLPAADKFAEPHFAMLWAGSIPRAVFHDGAETEVRIIAGVLGDARAPSPPPRSWAARTDADVAIWTIGMAPGARWTLPATTAGTNRVLYLFRGGPVRMAGREVVGRVGALLRPQSDLTLEAGTEGAELLLLQGRPIGEPVAARGPFVMNTEEQIGQAYADYRRTRFGGWPWPVDGPVHGHEEGRFARHPDGRVERARPPSEPSLVTPPLE